MTAILLAIKPEYAQKIAAGEKTYEFRRRLPAQKVTHVFIYSSAPEKRVIGVARVARIESGRKSDVWKVARSGAGITKKVFDSYFVGCEKANAIRLTKFRPLESISPIDLGVSAIPQSFCYIHGVPAWL